ncbi:hypothetical protein Vadar_021447 [Vaccinium darrowii]|nr:hypothetical protein Vadar_021447 [Vaccinium darrowii]
MRETPTFICLASSSHTNSKGKRGRGRGRNQAFQSRERKVRSSGESTGGGLLGKRRSLSEYDVFDPRYDDGVFKRSSLKEGVGNPLTVRNLKELVKFHSPDCIFLMESKNHSSKINAIRKELGYSEMVTVEPIGIGGGLSLLWKHDIDVEILEKQHSFLEATVKDGRGFHSWRVFFLHAPAGGYVERKAFWQVLRDKVSRVRQNCMLLGDFNAITSNDEKYGGSNKEEWELRDFRAFISESQLIDMGYVGYPFTWNNKRQGRNNIRERLDRALINSSWRLKYPTGVLHHLRPMGSDHCPILVDSDGGISKPRQRFVFDRRWSKDENCQEIITKAWNLNVEGSKWFKVQAKIMCCRLELLKWRTRSGSNSGRRMQQLQEELDRLGKMDFFDAEKYATCEEQLKQAYKDDERRVQNRVKGIENSDGIWKEEFGDISQVVLEYFKNIFSSDGAQRVGEVLRCVKRCVSNEMNVKLIRPISAVEENLRQRGILSVEGCPLCGNSEESVLHLVAQCPFARAVWFSSPFQIDSQGLECSSFIHWWSALMQRGQGMDNEVVWKSIVAYMVWGIWKSRNRANFEHVRDDPVWVMQHAINSAAEFLTANKEAGPKQKLTCDDRPSKQACWQPPPAGLVKLNFDGAFIHGQNSGGVGVVARADDGSFLFARSCGGLRARSALMMESLALRASVLLAKENGIRKVIFEGDAKGLIDVLNGNAAGREEIQLLVWDILQLCNSSFDEFSFVYVGRKGNGVAHELARKGCSLGNCSNLVAIPPIWLWDLICREKRCY